MFYLFVIFFFIFRFTPPSQKSLSCATKYHIYERELTNVIIIIGLSGNARARACVCLTKTRLVITLLKCFGYHLQTVSCKDEFRMLIRDAFFQQKTTVSKNKIESFVIYSYARDLFTSLTFNVNSIMSFVIYELASDSR